MAKLRKDIPNNKQLVRAYETLGGYDVMSTNFTRTVAKHMIEKGIVQIEESPDNKRTTAQKTGYKVSSIVRSLNDHLSYNDCTRISGDWIIKYCRFFGCTPDFLYGYTDDSYKAFQIISDKTGLHFESIMPLITANYLYNDEQAAYEIINTLNAILSDCGCAADFLLAVGAMLGTSSGPDSAYGLELSGKYPLLKIDDLNEHYQRAVRLEKLAAAIENIKANYKTKGGK